MKINLENKGKYIVFSLIHENEKSENFFSLGETGAKPSLALFNNFFPSRNWGKT